MSRIQSARVPSTPAEIETIRALIAAGKTSSEVARAVNRSRNSVLGIVDRKKLGPWMSFAERSAPLVEVVPADFETLWLTMRQGQLAKHYGVSRLIVTAWIAKLGLVRLPDMSKANAARRKKLAVRASRPRLVSTRVQGHRPSVFADVFRDRSPAGDAAETLRRDGWKVNRCNAAGHYDASGKMWRCGTVIVTEAELFERAKRAAEKIAA